MERPADIPFGDIRIDKDGIWYFRGAVMFRKDIVNFFYQNLRQDPSGRYLIELEDDCCWLDVEDTAFVVKSVSRQTDGGVPQDAICLLLSDDTLEVLDPDTLRISPDNIPYCLVKDGRFEARFTRASYYQLADFIEYDGGRNAYGIIFNGRFHDVNDTGIN